MPILGDAVTDSTLSPASPFEIEELSGDQRLLRLVGRALPYRPIEFPGTMRAQITYYAGNPIGTLQVLGAQEEQTSVSGFWKDRFVQTTDATGAGVANPDGAALVDDVPLANVRVIVQTVDDFRRKGQLVEVRWNEQRRRGVISKFTSKWHNPHDVEWEIQFSWISQGEEDAAPLLDEIDQQGISADLQAATNAIAADSAAPFSLDPSVVEQFSSLYDAVDAATVSATDVVDKTVAQVTSPIDAALRMMAVLQNAADGAQTIMDFAYQRVDRAVVQEPMEAISFGQSITASLYLRQLRSDARDSRNVAVEHRAALRAKTGQTVVPQTHVVRQGEDLRTVSTQFYGRPDDWRRLALFNGFDGAQVPVGTVLAIPPATPDASRSGVA